MCSGQTHGCCCPERSMLLMSFEDNVGCVVARHMAVAVQRGVCC